MSEVEQNASDVEAGRKRYVSKRGRFEIKANPAMQPTMKGGNELTTEFDVTALAETVGEEAARQKVEEMMQAVAPGISENVLFSQNTDGGMSLVHIWFGPNLPLFRHSHPWYGDCLYYVAAGEIIMGRRHLGPGSVFFIPNGHPYKYSAGPEGAEVLEFRAGGGEPNQPKMRIDERTLSSVQSIIDTAKANQPRWKRPDGFGDTGHVKSAGPEEETRA